MKSKVGSEKFYSPNLSAKIVVKQFKDFLNLKLFTVNLRTCVFTAF